VRLWSRLAARSVLYGNPFGLTPVIVYQMAKVGSSAIVEALRREPLPLFHVHRMSAEHLERMRAERRARGWLVPPIQRHDRVGLALNAKIIAAGRPAKIVTLVRDPIARNLSSYFEHLDAIWNVRDAHAVIPLDELCSGFVERFLHDEPLTWFDDEMLPVLGVDVYEHPFPADGHTTIGDILILRSELPDDVKRSALSSFLSRAIAPLRRVNETRDTAKGAVYEQFRRALRIPDDYVARMRSSRYYQHFYGARPVARNAGTTS
jgi:hypothetical protein